MARVLMVSKPIAPPWNDSSKNLVRDLATHLQRHRATVMIAARQCAAAAAASRTRRCTRSAPPASRPRCATTRACSAGCSRAPRHDLWHFFFAPNPRSSLAGRVAARAAARADGADRVQRAARRASTCDAVLFADRTVVLSRHTEARLLAAGVPRARAAAHPAGGRAARAAYATATARACASELGLPAERAA